MIHYVKKVMKRNKMKIQTLNQRTRRRQEDQKKTQKQVQEMNGLRRHQLHHVQIEHQLKVEHE